MEDELTERMHSEFTIDAKTEEKHRAFSAFQSGCPLKEAARIYDVDYHVLLKYRKEYEVLKG